MPQVENHRWRHPAATVCVCRSAHTCAHTRVKNNNKKKDQVGQARGFLAHTYDITSVRPTHFALRPGGWGGERGRGRAFFGLTEEAILLTSDPQRGAILGFGALPGTQRVPRQRLPVRYRNKKHQPTNQSEGSAVSSEVWLRRQHGCQDVLRTLWEVCCHTDHVTHQFLLCAGSHLCHVCSGFFRIASAKVVMLLPTFICLLAK